nr:MAG TPA: hypothetical protein [Caudoviricetes sp.]
MSRHCPPGFFPFCDGFLFQVDIPQSAGFTSQR